MREDEPYDWRLDELHCLGDLERRLAAEMLEARDSIAQLVKQLLPHHAPESRINTVVEASGLQPDAGRGDLRRARRLEQAVTRPGGTAD